jgi:hypothetical protein
MENEIGRMYSTYDVSRKFIQSFGELTWKALMNTIMNL